MTELKITGMTCEHCQKAVTNALEGVAGVDTVTVDLDTGIAKVGGSPDVQALVSAVEEEGYQASPLR
ncbi:MAG: heavy-metal-associated domain-containing protein [Deinococcota bacterium]|jgi:copper chaperone|nr:heavy-metal-associated domain-containing protein [Deinococcota bacterium]